jgi:transcriptional regulator with XRE-family HTH domain
MPPPFATRLKKALSNAKLSRNQLAERMGIKPMSVHQWCMHRVPRQETIKLLAEILDVEFNWLAYGTGPEAPNNTAEFGTPQRADAWQTLGSGLPSEMMKRLPDYAAQFQDHELDGEFRKMLAKTPTSQVLELARKLMVDPTTVPLALEMVAVKRHLLQQTGEPLEGLTLTAASHEKP